MRPEHDTEVTEIRLVTELHLTDQGRLLVTVTSVNHGNAVFTSIGTVKYSDGDRLWYVEDCEGRPLSYGKSKHEVLADFARTAKQQAARWSV